jgi:hypothetical protein
MTVNIKNAPTRTLTYVIGHDVDGKGGRQAVGTATFANVSAFATSSQGGKADAATFNWVTTYGAVGDGTTAAQTAFTAAVAAVTARNNSTAAFSAMTYAPDCEVYIPSGIWHLTADVDTVGKSVTWVVDDAAQFTSGSAAYLRGKVVRRSRKSSGFPFGLLDHATGDSAMIGGGSYDNSPLVTGFTNPNQVSSNETIDLVGRYTDATAVDLLHSSAANYTATTCVLTTPIDIKKLRPGMVIQTRHSPTVYRAQVTSWDSTGTTITVAGGWYLFGSTSATTPSSSGTPIVDFNPFHKVWGQNTNFFLTATGYAFQAAGHEIGMWNDKVTPTIAEDSSGRTWGEDVVNLGPRKVSIGFVARGNMFEGYRATGMDIGFRSAAYSGLGYAAPTVGFEHQGAGTSFRSKTAAGVTDFSVSAGVTTLGSSGGSSEFRFINSAAASYDSRIISSGGTGTNGQGVLTIDTVLTLSKTLRPSTDNLYECGGASNRWTIVFATTGTINTSDPRFKRFYDAFDKAENDKLMASLKRAVTRLPIRLYQWLDALAEKGEDARMHIGVSAQDVIEAFDAEGLDARRFAIFCEDEEFEQVEVISEIEVPEEVEQEQDFATQQVIDGKVIVTVAKTIVMVPKIVELPMFEADGETPIMLDKQKVDEIGQPVFYLSDDGKVKPVIIQVPAMARVPVMRKEQVTSIEERATGNKRMGIRYDQLAMLMIAALR